MFSIGLFQNGDGYRTNIMIFSLERILAKVSYEFFEDISIILLSVQGAFKVLSKISLKR